MPEAERYQRKRQCRQRNRKRVVRQINKAACKLDRKDRHNGDKRSPDRPFEALADKRLPIAKKTPYQNRRSDGDAQRKMIQQKCVDRRLDIERARKAVDGIADRYGCNVRHKSEEDRRKRNGGGRNIKRQRLPAFAVENTAPHRIAKTEMHEQRREKCERNIVDQGYSKVEILPKIQRPIYVECERREANRCEMEHERRPAALFEKNKDTGAEPNDADQRKKYYRRRPSRKRIDIP